MDIAVVKDPNTFTLSISNETDGLCAVRVTKMSDGSTQYKSAMLLDTPVNQKTAFAFSMITSENYMIEAWHYNNSTKKLVPTVVKYA